MAQFSDLPLQLPEDERIRYSPFCHARHIADYLEAYVRSHTYNDQCLHDRIHFNARVTNATRRKSESDSAPSWTVECIHSKVQNRQPRDASKPHVFTILANKLVICTGLASQPLTPPLSGAQQFAGLALHSKDFAKYESQILNPVSQFWQCKRRRAGGEPHCITIMGGGKSAADIIYACASAPFTSSESPISIAWIIRPDGNGPAALLPPDGAESFYTRLVAAFLPFPSRSRDAQSWLETIVSRTQVGRWVTRKLWQRVDRKYRTAAAFDRHTGRENGFPGLESDTPVFWQNDSSGINQHKDFWDVVSRRVKVYRRNVERIEEDHLVLRPPQDASEKGCTTLPTDVLIYSTGWTPTFNFLDRDLAQNLGAPLPLSESTEDVWQEREAKADADLLQLLPDLGHPPPYRRQPASLTPSRLYKTMAPIDYPEDRSVLFLGALVVGNNFLVAEVQALWAVAWLDGRMHVSLEEMQRDVAMTVAWNRRRYLNKGQLGNWFFFDVVKYADALLDQLGLKSYKSSWWLKRLLSPLRPGDLRGLCDEYKALYGSLPKHRS